MKASPVVGRKRDWYVFMLGRIPDRAYDHCGRLTRLTAYKDSSAGTGIEYTDYLYSKAGVTTRVIYPDDSST